MSQLFPIFLDLKGKNILLFGGGEVALEKIEKLARLGGKLTVISRDFSKNFLEFVENDKSNIKLIQKEISLDDIKKDYYLIMSATNDSLFNEKLVERANSLSILINSADDRKNCDFFMTSTIQRGPLQIAISTEGKFPGLARAVRRLLETIIPLDHSKALDAVVDVRKRIIHKYPDFSERTKILKNLAKKIENQYLNIN